jgi:uncharacterized membrane protein YcaP (DUF421 family)
MEEVMDWLTALIGSDDGSAATWQFCVRALLLLPYGILCIRIAGRRTFSNLTPLDIFVAIVVGSNISRAMTGKAPFVPALVATLLLVALHRLLAMMTVHSNLLARFIKGRPVELVRDGKVDRAALRSNHLSEDDLIEGLRMEQAARVEDVALATFERGGKISVVPKSK